MRILLTAFTVFSLGVLGLSGGALADEAEGEIKNVNEEKRTITLDDGKSYKMPGEFDVASLSVGDEIVLAFDQVNGENLVTDMTLPEGQ